MSITYELALKLKEAGFPQYGDGNYHDSPSYIKKLEYAINNKTMLSRISPDDDMIYLPTLSELIEECGDRFDELIRLKHKEDTYKYSAYSYPCEECGYEGLYTGRGSTPEEAVAQLYLELNRDKIK